jgi:hypothetical protein
MEVTRAKIHGGVHSETHWASSMFSELATCCPAITAVFRILAL